LTEEELRIKVDKANQERKEKLVIELLKKLAPYIAGKDKGFESQKEDIQEKLEAPGGPALLLHVSYIYIQEAKKSLGRFLGVEGWIAGIEETGHAFKQSFSLISSVVKLQVAQDKLEQHGQQDEELENEIMSHGLSTIWKLGQMEIEKMVRDVCQTLMKEAPDKKSKKKRASALKELGEVYRREVKLAKKRGLDATSPFEFLAKGEEGKEDEKAGKEHDMDKEKVTTTKEKPSKEKAKTPSKQKS